MHQEGQLSTDERVLRCRPRLCEVRHSLVIRTVHTARLYNLKNSNSTKKMTTTKAARIAEFPVKSSRPAAVVEPLKPIAEPAKPAEPLGWDPYEVWRTRVLMPRLQDQAEPPIVVATRVAIASSK